MTDKVEFDRRMLEALVCPLTQGTCCAMMPSGRS